MGASISLRHAIALLVPPRCAVCVAPCGVSDVLCARCEDALGVCRPTRLALPGLDLTVAAAPYEGIARELVRALKFGARTALARQAAHAIATALDVPAEGGRVVPVPAAPSRLRRRGFDPAEAIASALAAELDLPVQLCLARDDGPRQVGRRRRARLGDPPRVRVQGPAPERAILVDDVLTTGATLAACAGALRAGGCRGVVGATFARSLGVSVVEA